MEILKKILTSKQAFRFYWNTLNGILGLAVVYFTQINWVYAPVIIALLNGISKEINNYVQ